MIDKKKFPRYFILDGEIPCRIFLDKDEVVGENYRGYPRPPLQILSEGREISREEYYKACEELISSTSKPK